MLNFDFAALSLSSGLRRGVDITVSVGDKQVRLLAVDLKSGCFNDTGRWKKTDCETFHKQITILEQWIDARASEDLPFLVLGDFNHRFTDLQDSMWTDIDDSTPPNADLMDAGAGQTATCWNKKYPEYIDHIVADLRAAKLVVSGSFQPMHYDEKIIDDRISDHCPVSVRVAF